MSPFDAAIRELLRDLIGTEVLPATREEMRLASSNDSSARRVGSPLSFASDREVTS